MYRYVGGSRETDWPWYEFRVSPSCPPDKRIHMRGGTLWMGPGAFSYDNWGTGNIVEPQIADFTDATSIGQSITFTTANYYQTYMLLFGGDNPYVTSFSLWGATTEFATSTGAEQFLLLEMQESVFDTSSLPYPWQEVGFPLCGVILRNDGTISTAGRILPIDSVNRGRSYIWPTDLRPRHYYGS